MMKSRFGMRFTSVILTAVLAVSLMTGCATGNMTGGESSTTVAAQDETGHFQSDLAVKCGAVGKFIEGGSVCCEHGS